VLYITLVFQDPNRGKDGVIGQRRLLRQLIENLLDGG
jgi:hypothetical protein